MVLDENVLHHNAVNVAETEEQCGSNCNSVTSLDAFSFCYSFFSGTNVWVWLCALCCAWSLSLSLSLSQAESPSPADRYQSVPVTEAETFLNPVLPWKFCTVPDMSTEDLVAVFVRARSSPPVLISSRRSSSKTESRSVNPLNLCSIMLSSSNAVNAVPQTVKMALLNVNYISSLSKFFISVFITNLKWDKSAIILISNLLFISLDYFFNASITSRRH